MSHDIRRYLDLLLLLENDDEAQERDHRETLERTGFWGAAGAGCVILAQSTGRILLAHRSRHVEQPGTWGGWGGAIDRGEDPAEAVEREVREEAGYHGEARIVPLYVFAKGSFRYFNFLVVVADEFQPELNWENQGFAWCDFGDWPQPLHFGLVALFNDPKSLATIRAHVENAGAGLD